MKSNSFHRELRNFLFRNSPIPLLIYDGATLRILGANEAACTRYGYTCREFRAMTVRELRPRSDSSALDSAVLLDHDMPSRSLWTHVDRAGRPFPVEVRVSPFVRTRRKLSMMSVIDASAWSEARQKLVRSEEIHRSMVEESPFGIFRYNLTTSRIMQANPASLRISGCTLEAFSSLHLPDRYVDPKERARVLSGLFSAGSVRDVELGFRRLDGSIVRVSFSGYLCRDSETNEDYIQGYVQDVTRQRELEEQLSHSHRMEAVGRLAGGVAHDFNNITQSISLSCELALQSQLPQAVESKLLDIMQQAGRAAEITRQLLAFSRRQVLQPRVVNINHCIRKSLPMLRRAVGEDVTLELRLDEKLDHVFIDPEQLAVVLLHLADNARAAMPQGGELCIATADSPTGRGGATGHSALLTISDTGMGMNRATLARIFEPFFTTKDTPLTTGLGLSTVHGIVEQSKGHIECESAPGRGTTFRIYLPTATQDPSPTRGLTVVQQDPGRRLLLAEDDPVVNKHLTHALTKAGFVVDSVSDGQEALQALENGNYELLVTDIIMPRVGGIELTRRLRERRPEMPVVLISGYNEEMSVMQMVPPERVCYLQKPFPTSRLAAMIAQLLSGVREAEVKT